MEFQEQEGFSHVVAFLLTPPLHRLTFLRRWTRESRTRHSFSMHLPLTHINPLSTNTLFSHQNRFNSLKTNNIIKADLRMSRAKLSNQKHLKTIGRTSKITAAPITKLEFPEKPRRKDMRGKRKNTNEN